MCWKPTLLANGIRLTSNYRDEQFATPRAQSTACCTSLHYELRRGNLVLSRCTNTAVPLSPNDVSHRRKPPCGGCRSSSTRPHELVSHLALSNRVVLLWSAKAVALGGAVHTHTYTRPCLSLSDAVMWRGTSFNLRNHSANDY